MSTTTKGMRTEVYDRLGKICFYCGIEVVPDKTGQIDHVIPLSKEGATSRDNLVPSCSDCNYTKFNRSIKEFAPEAAERWELYRTSCIEFYRLRNTDVCVATLGVAIRHGLPSGETRRGITNAEAMDLLGDLLAGPKEAQS